MAKEALLLKVDCPDCKTRMILTKFATGVRRCLCPDSDCKRNLFVRRNGKHGIQNVKGFRIYG